MAELSSAASGAGVFGSPHGETLLTCSVLPVSQAMSALESARSSRSGSVVLGVGIVCDTGVLCSVLLRAHLGLPGRVFPFTTVQLRQTPCLVTEWCGRSVLGEPQMLALPATYKDSVAAAALVLHPVWVRMWREGLQWLSIVYRLWRHFPSP